MWCAQCWYYLVCGVLGAGTTLCVVCSVLVLPCVWCARCWYYLACGVLGAGTTLCVVCSVLVLPCVWCARCWYYLACGVLGAGTTLPCGASKRSVSPSISHFKSWSESRLHTTERGLTQAPMATTHHCSLVLDDAPSPHALLLVPATRLTQFTAHHCTASECHSPTVQWGSAAHHACLAPSGTPAPLAPGRAGAGTFRKHTYTQ